MKNDYEISTTARLNMCFGKHHLLSLADDIAELGMTVGEALDEAIHHSALEGYAPTMVYGLPSSPVVVLVRADLVNRSGSPD